MPGFSSMLQMLPPELGSILDTVQIMEEREPEPQHPCAREVDICTRETHSMSRAAIEDCLIRHLPQLSRECQCFVHHITNGRASAQQPSAVAQPRSTLPMVHTVSVPTPKPAEHLMDVHTQSVHHSAHSLSCLLIFTALFLFLLVRACCQACCFRSSVAQRRVVLVPPEHAVIRTVKPHPMLAVESADAKAVQVAEPLR